MTIAKIEDAIAALKRGGMVIVVDDEKRENEGDIIVASDSVTPQTIAFMMKNARGLICIAMQGERLDELDIPLMVPRNTELHKTAFTVSVDYLPGTTTGISAADRAATVKALVSAIRDPATLPVPDTFFLCGRIPWACSGGLVTRKLRWTLRSSPGSFRQALYAKSRMTTAVWPGCHNFSLSRPSTAFL